VIASIAICGAALSRPDWIAAAGEAFQFICDNLAKAIVSFHFLPGGSASTPLSRTATPAWRAPRSRCGKAPRTAAISSAPLPGREPWTRILGRRAGRLRLFARNTDLPEQVPHAARLRHPDAVGQRHDDRRAWQAFYATVDQAYAERANTLIQAFAGDVATNYMQCRPFSNNFEFCTSCLEIISLWPAIRCADTGSGQGRARPQPAQRLPMIVAPGETLPAGHPAEARPCRRPAHRLCCGGMVCSPPLTSAAVLSHVLPIAGEFADVPHRGTA